MRVFACPQCRAWVEFEDRLCLACGTELAYDPDRDDVVRAADRTPCHQREPIGCSWVASGDPAGATRGVGRSAASPSR